MLRFAIATALCGLAIICQTTAQQFSDVPLPVNYPGISDGCFNALNTTVNCPRFLPSISIENPQLSSDQISAFCTSEWESNLNSVQSSVSLSCAGQTVPFGNNLVPASFMADNFLYTYALSCRKDRDTGEYCDNLYAKWVNETTEHEHACSDCELGLQQIGLNSSLGYDEETASDFSLLTSSCGASGYSITIPSSHPYPSQTTTTTTSSLTARPQGCSGHYNVVTGDSCYTVSHSQGVATFDLLEINGLDVFCREPLEVGASLCLPPPCATYEIKQGDSCESILRANKNVTWAQFSAWNVNFNSDCSNIRWYTGFDVCLSSPYGEIEDPGLYWSTRSTTVSAAANPTHASDKTSMIV
ncbi:hypothetical protein Q7P36_007015 [Cladosporium allicinum]